MGFINKHVIYKPKEALVVLCEAGLGKCWDGESKGEAKSRMNPMVFLLGQLGRRCAI